MLQNDPVRNLHYDTEIRVAQQQHQTTIEPRVFDGPVRITSQPRKSNEQQQRTTLPISTIAIEQNTSRCQTFVPIAGYDFLTDHPSVHIEQTFELNESLTSVSSENRYVVRSPLGDAIFAATESSTARHRLFWGAGRPFQMHVLDKSHQEALLFRKKLALGSLCCQPKNLEIWIPPGNLLGRIVQSPTFFKPVFYIEDGASNNPLFCVEGPENSGVCCFFLPQETYFKVHSGGDLRASIDHKWMANKSQFTTNIYFSDSKLSAKERALILAAGFMMEYLYFQRN